MSRPISFGISLVPLAEEASQLGGLARLAEDLGFELIGIQDHPYQRRFLDTWTLLSHLAAITDSISLFPDVANLPLRPPAVLATAAASLDVLSGGRFELGLGAGSFWEAIEGMGGPSRSPGEAVDALEEAIQVIRLMWSGERSLSFEGRHYRLKGIHSGPVPAHDMGIWLGAYGPRMLELTGRRADGWVVSLGYARPERLREMNDRIDKAARDVGRSPGDIRRIYNLMGLVGGNAGEDGFHGPPGRWIEAIGEWVDRGMDTFIFWPPRDRERQFARFAEEVAPAFRG